MKKETPVVGSKKTTEVVGVRLKVEQIAEFERRAESIGIATTKYMRIVLENWLASGKTLTLQEK